MKRHVSSFTRVWFSYQYRNLCILRCPPIVNGITVEQRRIPVTKPEGEILIRIYTPDPDIERETFPVLVNIHGTFCQLLAYMPLIYKLY